MNKRLTSKDYKQIIIESFEFSDSDLFNYYYNVYNEMIKYDYDFFKRIQTNIITIKDELFESVFATSTVGNNTKLVDLKYHKSINLKSIYNIDKIVNYQYFEKQLNVIDELMDYILKEKLEELYKFNNDVSKQKKQNNKAGRKKTIIKPLIHYFVKYEYDNKILLIEKLKEKYSKNIGCKEFVYLIKVLETNGIIKFEKRIEIYTAFENEFKNTYGRTSGKNQIMKTCSVEKDKNLWTKLNNDVLDLIKTNVII